MVGYEAEVGVGRGAIAGVEVGVGVGIGVMAGEVDLRVGREVEEEMSCLGMWWKCIGVINVVEGVGRKVVGVRQRRERSRS